MFANPVQGPRIVPYLNSRQPTDVLPNGRPAFRVTQQFGSRDIFFNDGRIHGAMDIGNFYCGDRILAMKRGTVRYLTDENGALGVEVRHSNGYRTQIWHISRWRVPNGSFVRRKKWIADVGQTGIDIGGCHAHVVVINRQGQAVDPWRLLDQNLP